MKKDMKKAATTTTAALLLFGGSMVSLTVIWGLISELIRSGEDKKAEKK